MASTAQQLQRALEERAKEIEQLQNKLQRAESDRQKWEQQKRVLESKQPVDVQALTRQKRELQSQLQREESEKQELFMQINKLIGEVADLQSKAEGPNLSEANQRLEEQLQQLKAENHKLKSNVDSVQQKHLSEQKQEIGRLQKMHETELGKLSTELRKVQKEIEVKDAALQSLKLARPSSKEDELRQDVEHLRSELAQRSQENSQLLNQKLELEQFKNKLSDELDKLKQQLDENRKKLEHSGRTQGEILEIFEHAGVPSTSGMGTLKRKIDSLKSDVNEETTRRKKLETEMDQLRQTLNSSNTARQELTRRIEELRDENERLTEKASVEEELHTLMISLREAKTEIASKEKEASTWRQKSLKLEEQCDQLQSDLSHKDATLQKAEDELHSLRSNALDTDILSKFEAEMHNAKRESEENRQKLREALANRESIDAELSLSKNEMVNLKEQIIEATTKLEESEIRRQQLEQKRLDEIRRLRDDHRVEIDKMRREFLDEKERIAEKVDMAEEDAKKARMNLEEIRKSVEEWQKRLADTLNCPSNFDLMLSTIKENQHRLTELESELRDSQNIRRSYDNEELSRLRQKESEFESALSLSIQQEKRLEEKIRQIENQQLEVDVEKLRLLESDRDELTKMNDDLRLKIHEDKRLHDSEMRNMRDEMIENIRRLSDLLEAETKRLQTANGERDRWLKEANRLEQECAQLRRQLEMPSRTTADISEVSELRSKVSELMDENAKLAGDLLKLETSAIDYEEQSRWKREKAQLEAQIEQLKRHPNGTLTNGLNGNPTPKPRKTSTAPSSSMSNIANGDLDSIDELPANGINGDSTKMKSELEKQKRLINVLRKKLQTQQIQRVQQSRSLASFCNS